MPRLNRDQLLALARSEITETTIRELDERLQNGQTPLIIDIRERDEFEQGHLPGAIFVPRGFLELRIEQFAFDRETPIVLYCAGGVRSALAARNLREMGYTDTESLVGGYSGWKNSGLSVQMPRLLTGDQKQRYSRHVLLPEVGQQGQLKLLDARVLLVGAGGLGSPAALYLAAAGVGTLGIIDFDVVDLSNLQRQILHGESWLGQPKVESAIARLNDLNPDVQVVPYQEPITSANALGIIKDYDIVLNGSDNFPTRYLVNDACHFLRKPLVDASIFMFEGQVTVYHPGSPEEGIEQGPCYRCLYPDPPPPGEVPSCAEAGVLGVLPGIVGSIQAVEAIKLILGKGESLIGRLLLFDAMDMSFHTLNVRRDSECPVCGSNPTITALIDYEQFCGLPPTTVASNGH
ncbi:MAG: molybdopterin-synthase adenylyltransferase MoeB [Chloroflexota bacterium]|nr:molybdopterin-synthase adenylyltransferase MoeB [Chloroflexota bacterium]